MKQAGREVSRVAQRTERIPVPSGYHVSVIEPHPTKLIQRIGLLKSPMLCCYKVIKL
jgi:hypothetical protein